MRYLLALLPLLAACAPTPPKVETDDLKSKELAIVMAVGVQETSQLKPGQWALYRVQSAGSTMTLSTRLAAFAGDGGTFWIENRTTTPYGQGQPRVMISKYQIDGSARPVQLWVAEPPAGRPMKVFPGTDDQGRPIQAPRPAPSDASARVEIADETITIPATGKSYECTRLTSRATYAGGRETTLVTWCSKKVPFWVSHGGKTYGGVVKRTYGAHTLELDAQGTDAVPELTLPEK